MEYTVTRSRRKTIALCITKDAVVEVRAPLRAPKADIDRFVASQRAWLENRLAMRRESLRSRAAFALGYGDTARLQGRAYPIAARAETRIGFDGSCFYLPPGLTSPEIKSAVIQVYKALAEKILARKVCDYANRMGVAPAAVKVSGAKTRWGSCSGKNSLNFSWRLIMGGDEVIDYVVVHELAHIREHNHSARFWAVVASVLPDYKERQKKLKGFQKQLEGEDWDA